MHNGFMALIFVGLDGEMTGPDLDKGHRLCQIGVAAFSPDDGWSMFVSDIGQPTAPIDPRASQVHGFSDERIRTGPAASLVDEQLAAWLVSLGATVRPRKVVPVGWNVGAFDMPFVRADLPDSYELFSRRTCDLNAAAFTLSSIVKISGSPASLKGLKRAAKRAAAATLAAEGFPEAWHDAGYDAAAALAGWLWMRDRLSDLIAPL